MPSPAIPGLFFCFAAMVLLILVSVSAPIWNSISFLDANINGQVFHFGCWGYTGSKSRLGYTFNPEALGLNNNNLNAAVIKSLTFVLVLHPIAAALAALSVIFGFCGASYSRFATVLMSFCAALATLLTMIVWVIDMILWGIARNRIRHDGPPGSTAQYGNANWLTLGALVALMLGFCAAGLGSCGRFSRRSKFAEKV